MSWADEDRDNYDFKEMLRELRMLTSDQRYAAMYTQLSRLPTSGLKRILAEDTLNNTCYDSGNYVDGKFCPIAIGLGISEAKDDADCAAQIEALGFNPRNLKDIQGEFYTIRRQDDLRFIIRRILQDREEKSGVV